MLWPREGTINSPRHACQCVLILSRVQATLDCSAATSRSQPLVIGVCASSIFSSQAPKPAVASALRRWHSTSAAGAVRTQHAVRSADIDSSAISAACLPSAPGHAGAAVSRCRGPGTLEPKLSAAPTQQAAATSARREGFRAGALNQPVNSPSAAGAAQGSAPRLLASRCRQATHGAPGQRSSAC